jgi:hypothetical protein
MMRNRLVAVFVLGLVLCVPALAKKKAVPAQGLIAASVGDDVVVVQPILGQAKHMETGPVAWLFPAPGGILFAPDLVNGRTTVIDLRTQIVREVMDGVTMPHFGVLSDRYVAIASKILIMSYPERALISSIDFAIERPWQVAVVADDRVLLALERSHDGAGEPVLAAVKLDEGRPVYRRPLAGDPRRFSLSEETGLLALADTEGRQVVLMDPASATPFQALPVAGRPMDLAFVGDGTSLVIAAAAEDDRGILVLIKLKQEKKNGIVTKERWTLDLRSAPVRLAVSPDRRHVAVASTSGGLSVIDISRQEEALSLGLAEVPRDLVWCDPTRPGPMLPEWSDRKPPSIDLGNPERDFFKKPTPISR